MLIFHPTCEIILRDGAGNDIHKSVILTYTLGLILDSTGFAKPKVHAEGRLAS
jgi:hypothetical protein